MAMSRNIARTLAEKSVGRETAGKRMTDSKQEATP